MKLLACQIATFRLNKSPNPVFPSRGWIGLLQMHRHPLGYSSTFLVTHPSPVDDMGPHSLSGSRW